MTMKHFSTRDERHQWLADVQSHIMKRVYPVQGTACAIWLGYYKNGQCYLRPPAADLGHGVNVREELFGALPEGMFYKRPTCHNGRCLAPEHQRPGYPGGKVVAA